VHASEGNTPVVAVFVSEHRAPATASEEPLLSSSPRKSPSAAQAMPVHSSHGSSSRSPLPRYIPVSVPSPRPKTFGSDSGAKHSSLNDCRSSQVTECDVVKISSPVMVLGISGAGSGKKQNTQPNMQLHSSPRRISSSPTEHVHSRVVANSPRSVNTTPDVHHKQLQASSPGAKLPESDRIRKADDSPVARNWKIFEKPGDLRDAAAEAAALAQLALATHSPRVSVAGISKISVNIKSKNSPSDQTLSPTGRSTAHAHPSPGVSLSGHKSRNRQSSPRENADHLSSKRGVHGTTAQGSADAVATCEVASANTCRPLSGTSPVSIQTKSPTSPFVSKHDLAQPLSPRSAAVASAALQKELRSASESAVSTGSSVSVLQLYPQNVVWNQDSSTLLRTFYADSTVHCVTVPDTSSPKSKRTTNKPPMRTPLKTSCADRAHTPVVSTPSVLYVSLCGYRILLKNWVFDFVLLRCHVYTKFSLQEHALVNLHTPACNVSHDMENRAIQPSACAHGTPSLLRQPSPLKDLWARSQIASLGQASPAVSKTEMPSPSPLKMHLFGNCLILS
jgi:hypothetical protein